MQNYYDILGVDRSASQDDIKRAYRRLASQHHPDKGGDTQRFQEIQAAYETLSDPRRRAQHDNPTHHQFNFQFGSQGFDFDNIFDIFRTQGFNQTHQRRGHVRMTLWVSLQDVAQGGTRTVRVSTPQGVTAVEITIPLGIDDGANVQYSGLAPGNMDLVVQFRIHPDSRWERQGLNLITEQRVVVWDLVTGGNVEVTDIYGSSLVTQIPPATQPGTLLRLRNRGLKNPQGQQGDAFVKIVVTIPPRIAPELVEAIRQYRDQ